MISRLILLGASGDLTSRFLLPGLARLAAAGELPDDFGVTGLDQQDWDDDQFRDHAEQALSTHAGDLPAEVRAGLVEQLCYRRTDVTDADAMADACAGLDDRPTAFYLALPTGIVGQAIAALGARGLADDARIAVEKPFGEDAASAHALNAQLADLLGDGWRERVFRIDHVLGMATIDQLLGLRLGTGLVASLWNGEHIAEVQVLWEETLALEGRASFYDRAGALEDVMQNHMMQALCLAAMEPPAHETGDGDDAGAVGEAKVELLRAVREPSPAASRRARYTSGELSGTGGAARRSVPDYTAEDGVDPDRDTETWAEVRLEVDTPRWRGTRFVLRAGKALAERRKGVLVRFRSGDAADTLWIGLDGPNEVRWNLALSRPGGAADPQVLSLTGPEPKIGLPPYSRVLLNLLQGGSALSVGAEEAELAWRVLDPVRAAWAAGEVAMEEYAAGSEGPSAADAAS